MGKDSEYYKSTNLKYIEKLNQVMNTLPDYTHMFLDDKRSNNPNTALAYARDLHVFFEFLTQKCPVVKGYEIKNIPLSLLGELQFQDINEYMDYLDFSHPENESAYSNNKHGLARKMASLRSFYRFMCTHELLQKDPTAGAKNIKLKKEDIIRLNSNEVNTLLDTVKKGQSKSKRQKKCLERTALRDNAILTLLLNTGIRVSECVGIDISDINFEEKSIQIVRKGGKIQYIYFNENVKEALFDYIKNERPNSLKSIDNGLFLNQRGERLTARSIERIVKKFSEFAVINKHITPHKMRSTYGTALYNETGDIKLVADVLGHDEISTTARFYAATEESRRRKAATIELYNKEPEI